MQAKFDDQGLIPAVVQDAHTGQVLTVAYMNAESLQRTVQTGQTWFWSRSRRELWNKGATSGNTQAVVGLSLDCDGDALLVQVEPAGPACHTGATGCFHEALEGTSPAAAPDPLGAALAGLRRVIAERAASRPEGSYTVSLLDEGLGKVCQKVGEEASEVIVAALTQGDDDLADEVADLLYHLTVLLQARALPAAAVAEKLEERRR